MDCLIRCGDGVAELVLVGSLDSSWSSYLSDRIDEVIRGGALDVRVDMAGVSYVSSNGIALLVRYHQQLRKIGGRLWVVSDSEVVGRVLRLSGADRVLHDDRSGPAIGEAPSHRGEAIEREGLSMLAYPGSGDRRPGGLALIGDPGRLRERGYDARDERIWMTEPGSAALGLGALGPSFDACRGRFGEFLAVAGVTAYRPGGGPGQPDFEHAAGDFVPTVRILYGIVFPVDRAAVIRFEARGEPGNAAVPLGRIAAACLERAGDDADAVGIVLAGEVDGLVGAALRQAPVDLPDGLDPFALPEVRDWLALTPEPEHAGATAIVVGVATRRPGLRLGPFVRTFAGASAPGLQGHFHAAVVPYRPLPGGPIELAATVAHLIEPGRIDAILHLLDDPRPIVGAGESTFTRRVIWSIPLIMGVVGERGSA